MVGLASRSCSETEPIGVDEKERELLRQQVAGWRVESVSGASGIRRDWTAQVRAAPEAESADLNDAAVFSGGDRQCHLVTCRVLRCLVFLLVHLTYVSA